MTGRALTNPARGLAARHITAVAAGNALSFYDFLTYSFFAIQIGRAFFPSKDPTASLLLSLATFGAGFLTRPLGGLIIGRMGDKRGRKPAMILSFTLMGIALLGISLTPSYASIGIAAPICAVLFRTLQGFALGGEIGPTTVYLIEAAPPERRGFYNGLGAATQDGSVMVAGIVGVVLSNVLTPTALDSYGWRIAFLLGAAIVPFGLLARRTLAETLDMEAALERKAAAKLGRYLPVAVFGVVLLASATVSNYALDYMTTYANHTLHMHATIAFGATVVIGSAMVVADLASGWLSDRFGRKPVMIVPYVTMMLCAVPAYLAISHFRTAIALFAASALLAVLQALGGEPMTTWMTESLPPSLRSGGIGVIYSLSIAVFGGTTQLMIAWLIALTGNPLAPAWYMVAALACGVIVMLMVRETAPVKTGGGISQTPSF
ncbi:MAG: MFS transporter [Alphaproteobacteria bacterium]|nr:MFS transporter [Alphaproteobacteria bacterium]